MKKTIWIALVVWMLVMAVVLVACHKTTEPTESKQIYDVSSGTAAVGLAVERAMAAEEADNLYVADMLGNSAVRFTPAGKMTVLAKDCFTRPSEPCFWRGRLYVADFGGTTLTTVEPVR